MFSRPGPVDARNALVVLGAAVFCAGLGGLIGGWLSARIGALCMAAGAVLFLVAWFTRHSERPLSSSPPRPAGRVARWVLTLPIVLGAVAYGLHAHWAMTTATDLQEEPSRGSIVRLTGLLGEPVINERRSRRGANYSRASTALVIDAAPRQRIINVHCPLVGNFAVSRCIAALEQVAGQRATVDVVDQPGQSAAARTLIVGVVAEDGAVLFAPADIAQERKDALSGISLGALAIVLIVSTILLAVWLVLRRKRST
jgi:hypothetical protein